MPDFARRRMMMVDTQVRPSDVTKFPIIDAMLSVPREAYVPVDLREAAYVGDNIALAPGRVVLDPRTLAKMLDALDIQRSEMVLVVAAGLGYSTAVVARLAEAVVAVEEDPALAAEAERTLSAEGVDNAVVMTGPLALGAARHGPYDVIVIEGGVESVPQPILDQLKDGGRIGAPYVAAGVGVVRIGIRRGGAVSWRDAFNAGAPVLPGFGRARAFTL
ncbi:MAG: protein-L-isoaspartate O-methyltransferase family protein [Gemmobacter sp.]